MKLYYRPEIDGLRAVAVFSVIFYHANFVIFNQSLFSGGFLGVDIFFVISGYLITSIILKEIYKTNNFSFINFYERRVRRIIPALLFVMLCSLPFAYLILLIDPIIDFSKSVISSIFFFSNFYFNLTGNVYGEESTYYKPFLHTWSLSVEEQFYILFPVFLVLIIKFFKKYLSIFLSIGILISISFSQYLSIHHPGFNFYQIFSRGFELLLGSLLSYFELNYGGGGSRKSSRVFNQLFPKLGIVLIIFSFFFFNDKDLLPSIYSLIPLSGVCLIIWFSHKDELVTKILSNKIFVFFGLISYSLYLFHYPIFAFSRILEIFNDYYKFIFIFLTIIISVFSYYYIERIFRDRKIISLKKLIIIILSSIVSLTSFNFYIIKDRGINQRLPKFFHKEIRIKKVTPLYQKENSQSVVLIGDSHAQALEYNFNEELKKNEFNGLRFSTKYYLKDFIMINRSTKKSTQRATDFKKNNDDAYKFLDDNSNLIIVLHLRWSWLLLETGFDNEEGFTDYKTESEKISDYFMEPINIKTTFQKQRENLIKEGLISQLNRIINQGHKLILVYPVPEMGFDPIKLLYLEYLKRFLFNKKEYAPSILSVSYDVYKKRHKSIIDTLDGVQSKNIYRIYPHSYFCDKHVKNRCVSNDKENTFYYDNNHLSLQGSKFVVDDIFRIIKEIK